MIEDSRAVHRNLLYAAARTYVPYIARNDCLGATWRPTQAKATSRGRGVPIKASRLRSTLSSDDCSRYLSQRTVLTEGAAALAICFVFLKIHLRYRLSSLSVQIIKETRRQSTICLDPQNPRQ